MSSDIWPPPEPLPKKRGLLTVVFVGLVATGLVVSLIVNRDSSAKADVGEKAPEFSLTLLDGTQFDLSRHFETDGRPVVLNLWASWCAPCRFEIPSISAWAAENPDVYVLGIAVEDRDAPAKALADELRPSYDLGIGDNVFRAAYPSIGLPATYFIDASGVVTHLVNGIVTQDSLDSVVRAR